MYFSYVLARGSLGISKEPKFIKLKNQGIDDPFKYFNNIDPDKCKPDFVTKEYSPFGSAKRMYFTIENALKIDFCRNTIENWYQNNVINDDEYYYLLAALINAVPFVSNTTGTYGAFLKKWDKRAYKPLYLDPPDIENTYDNICYNVDSIKLLDQLKHIDICYIDTPYTARQYPSPD